MSASVNREVPDLSVRAFHGGRPNSWPGLPDYGLARLAVGDDHGVHLLRISLLDRPGALGAVATALGEAGANIHAMEVVVRAGGYVVEDFLVRLSPDRLTDSLVAACHKIPDVSVDWVSRYPSDGNLQSDLETLESMTKDPRHAADILLAASPVVSAPTGRC